MDQEEEIEQNPSNEQMNALFDLLERLPRAHSHFLGSSLTGYAA